MNIAIVKVIIQGFVNDNIEHFDFRLGDWQHNTLQILHIADELENEEITELTNYLIKVKMNEHMFKGLES